MNKYINFKLIFLLMMAFSLLISSCSSHSSIRIGSKRSESNKHMSSSFQLLTGVDTKNIKLNEGQKLKVSYSMNLESGELSIILNDPDGMEVISFEEGKDIEEQLNIIKTGTYKIIVKGEKAKGSYDFRWEAK